jgi:glycosyltransferase involved in cell wall biosynthesis
VKVSIVTPSFNQAPFLEETMLSVFAQDYPDIEYVVVDDGSTDGSLEIARRHESRLHELIVQANAGQVAAINHGFERTTGELMAYLNSDDTLLPGAVSEMVAEFERDPQLVLVYGDAVYTDADSMHTGYLPSREWDPPMMVRRCDNRVVQPSSMWTRRTWNTAGPFDPRGYYFFDFELYLRLAPLGPARHVSRAWSTYREHATSKTVGDPLKKARDYVRFADEFLATDRLPAGLRPYAREGRARARLSAATELYGWRLQPMLVRRWLGEAFVLHPRIASRSSLALAAKSLLPLAVLKRFRSLARGADVVAAG